MKLIYGRGDCELQYPEENIKSVVIRYKGNVILKHNHLELIVPMYGFGTFLFRFLFNGH